MSAIVVLPVMVCHAQSTEDMVIMDNGDSVKGEIKCLHNGELEFTSDYMKDAVYLDCRRITRLESKDSCILGVTYGQRVTLTLHKLSGLDILKTC